MTAVVGQSVRRSDGDAKVRGTAVYGMDHAEAGMLYARLLRSPVAAGRLTRLDVSKALAMPGVRSVVTAADAPDVRAGWILKDQRLFARDDVRYRGEPIAALAADDDATAAAALAAIELEFEPIEPVVDLTAAVEPDARLVNPEWESFQGIVPCPREGNVAWEARLERGDVDAGFAAATAVVEDVFHTPRQHQSPIEPHVAVARFEAGRFVVHTPAQYPFLVRERIAEFLGLPTSAVRVIVPTIGGGFGGKIEALLEPYACLLARASGRPVRLANSRREELQTAGPRESAIVSLRTALASDGEILAQEAEVLVDNGAFSGETAAIASLVPLALGGTYRIPAARYKCKVVYTNTPGTAAFRGVAGPYCVFAQERHLDRIAGELGVDRRELRLRNVLRPGDQMVNGQVLEDAAFVEAFDEVERLAPWRPSNGDGSALRGVGLAAVTWLTNPGPGNATVKLEEDGTVGVITAATEIGSGALTTGVRQIVAEQLGVPFEHVHLLPPDTDAAGYDAGAQGSRTMFAIGNAAASACASVREQVLETASGMLEANPEDIEIVDGQVGVVGAPASRVPMAAVAQTALWSTGPIAATGKHIAPPVPFDDACAVGALFSTFAAATYSVHLAEVEVDPETGKVTILRYVVVQDVGRAVNPQMIDGQIHGGVVQGIGYALYEDLALDGGDPLVDGLESYRLPTALDAPPIETVILEKPCPYGPYGAKGAAEPPIVPVAAAIANAVADAIGRPINRLPIRPFDVLELLREEESR